MDLVPPRTLKVVLPSRREANFQDFALLLLHRFFYAFSAVFLDGFWYHFQSKIVSTWFWGSSFSEMEAGIEAKSPPKTSPFRIQMPIPTMIEASIKKA